MSLIKDKLDRLNKEIQLLAPNLKILRYKDRLIHSKEKLQIIINNKVNDYKSSLNRYIEMFKARDIIDKLSKGLAYTTNESGKLIRSVKDIRKDEIIISRLRDGIINSKVISVKKEIIKA